MIGKLEFIRKLIMIMMPYCLASEMKNIFIEEATTKAEPGEPGDVMYYADHLEEAIEEGIANLQ
jgi:hypothetical protein